MKKLGFFGMLALIAITFTACPGPIEPPIDEVVEDGFCTKASIAYCIGRFKYSIGHEPFFKTNYGY